MIENRSGILVPAVGQLGDFLAGLVGHLAALGIEVAHDAQAVGHLGQRDDGLNLGGQVDTGVGLLVGTDGLVEVLVVGRDALTGNASLVSGSMSSANGRSGFN